MDDQTATQHDETTGEGAISSLLGYKPKTADDLRKMLEDGRNEWGDVMRMVRENLRFSYGEPEAQWDAEALKARRGKRAIQQYNIVPGFIRPTINAVKEAPPEATVYPISDGATKQLAKHYAGALRAIQNQSNAPRTYIKALESAMRGSLGGWRITPKKIRGKTEILIQPIADVTKVFVDPDSVEFDFSDAKWIIIELTIGKEEGERDYPGSLLSYNNGKATIYEAWVQHLVGDDVQVCQYIFDDASPEPLSSTLDYPCKEIPFCFVTGEVVEIDGKRTYYCITSDLKSPQRELNYLKSEAISVMAQAPKSKYIADSNAVDDETELTEEPEVIWKKPGSEIIPVQAPPPPVGYMELAEDNINMARLITGIYPDPSLQAKADAPSGKAIKMQRMGSGIATYHYVDSLNHAIKRCAEICLEMIQIYWTDDSIRVALGADGTPTPISFGPGMVPDVANVDPRVGKFGVTVSVGPSYASQREAIIEQVNELIAKNPKLLDALGDWVVKQWNLPGSEEIAERMQLMLPKPIQDLIASKEEGSDPEEQIARARLQVNGMSQQLQQYEMVVKAMTEALNKERGEREKVEAEIASQVQMNDADNANALALEQMRAENAQTLQQMKAASDAALAAMKAEIDERLHHIKSATGEVAAENAHARTVEQSELTTQAGV